MVGIERSLGDGAIFGVHPIGMAHKVADFDTYVLWLVALVPVELSKGIVGEQAARLTHHNIFAESA